MRANQSIFADDGSSEPPVFYRDFDITFNRNPITGNLSKLINEQAIARSLKNIILTNYTERFYNPLFGSKVRASLFENMDAITASQIQSSVQMACKLENRVSTAIVDVRISEDNNAYEVSIKYDTINMQGQFYEIFMTIERAR